MTDQSAGITAHMVVKNEDRFIWYAVSAILPYVSQVLITDTGSTDQTIPIIKSFRDDRIVLQRENIHRPEELGKIRDRQIQETNTNWFWVVDGDEVYPQSLSKEIVEIVQTGRKELEGIVVGRYDLLGDIYHYQSESVGAYNIFGRRGHWVLRLLHKSVVPELHVSGTYPHEGYYDKENIEITSHDPKYYIFTNGRLWHAMYLKRSSKGASLADTFHRKKWKIELGQTIPTPAPNVFFASRPPQVLAVTAAMTINYRLFALMITPIKKIKRFIFDYEEFPLSEKDYSFGYSHGFRWVDFSWLRRSTGWFILLLVGLPFLAKGVYEQTMPATLLYLWFVLVFFSGAIFSSYLSKLRRSGSKLIRFKYLVTVVIFIAIVSFFLIFHNRSYAP